jgi:hypothetical protein
MIFRSKYSNYCQSRKWIELADNLECQSSFEKYIFDRKYWLVWNISDFTYNRLLWKNYKVWLNQWNLPLFEGVKMLTWLRDINTLSKVIQKVLDYPDSRFLHLPSNGGLGFGSDQNSSLPRWKSSGCKRSFLPISFLSTLFQIWSRTYKQI